MPFIAPTVIPAPGTSQVITDTITDRNGFVWKLKYRHLCGQFVTGDWWVYGSATVKSVTPTPKTITGPNGLPRFVNGSQINPSPLDHRTTSNPVAVGVQQGFDQGMYYNSSGGGGYGSTFNPELSVSFPKRIDPGQSLVSSFSENIAAGNKPQLRAVGILTCVDTIPDDNDFRPYWGRNKGSTYNYSAVDLATDAMRLDPTGTTPIALATVESWFDGPWFGSHVIGPQKEEMHPGAWMEEYSADQCEQVGNGMMTLMRDDLTAEALKPLAVGMIQAGLDWYHSWLERPSGTWLWGSGAGQGNAARPLIMLAGYLLGDSSIDAPVGNEVNQPFIVEETGGAGSGVYNYGVGGYGPTRPLGQIKWAAEGDPEWGVGHYIGEDGSYAINPWKQDEDTIAWYTGQDPPGFNSNPDQEQAVKYRRCCSIATWWGEAIFLLEAGLRTQWNTGLPHADVFWHLIDRYLQVESASGEPFLWRNKNRKWHFFMFQKFRSGYTPAVWNAASSDDQAGVREIDDTDSPYAVEIDDEIIEADATSGPVTVTLPSVVSKRRIVVRKKDASANAVTINTTASDLIDGAASKSTTTQYGGFTIEGVADHWVVTATT